jgi:predicted secreted protein
VLGVVAVNVTDNPELAVAATEKSAADTSWSVNAPNVMVCKRRDANDRVTLFAVL